MPSNSDDPKEAKDKGASRLFDDVKASANDIWLAGLGALSKAQAEGAKAFDSLVREGAEAQRKAQSAAGDTIHKAGQRMADVAEDVTARASGQWGKLEGLVDSQVASAMNRMGVSSKRELQALAARVEALEAEVARLRAAAGDADQGT
ncbi:MAG TPA: phasin family protein [Ramlibacter sp.]|nr:phasin family protein [Ramlibacter sp.]